jgi:peptidoglycan hydrolase-like protein with peptidoglycan-binding domain
VAHPCGERTRSTTARRDPPAIRRGDLLQELPGLVAEALAKPPEDGVLVVFHSAMIAYRDDPRRELFAALMRDLLTDPRVHWVSNDRPGALPAVTATGPQPPPGRYVLAMDVPTVEKGDTGDAVSQAQRALRRTLDLTLEVDGEFGPLTEAATKEFQQSEGLPVTGVVDEATWKALPDGNPVPLLQQGSKGDSVRSLQAVLTQGAFGLWETTPQGVDGVFGANTAASVRAFQAWAGCAVDGVVGPETWNAPLALEFVVGLQHTVGVQPVAEP